MSRREAATPGPLERHDGEPVFDEPWQAQVLALAFSLVECVAFSARDWSAALGAELSRAQAAGAPDNAQTYYRSALAALETLLAERGLCAADDLTDRVETWRRAYLNTPHGQPVELSAGATIAPGRD